MAYDVYFTPQARKDVLSLDKNVARHIALRIEGLSQNADTIAHFPLKEPFKDKFKLRAGDWRAIYSIEHKSRIITVYSIRHRGEVYKI